MQELDLLYLTHPALSHMLCGSRRGLACLGPWAGAAVTGQGGWGAGSSREGPCRAQNTLGSVDKTEKKTLRSLQIKR